jgi:hypothetical protein
MTWQRAGQLSAETQSLLEGTQLSGGAVTISGTKANTGSYSFRGPAAGAIGIALSTTVTAARVAAFQNHNTGLGSSYSQILRFTVGSVEIIFAYRENDNTFALRAGYAVGTSTARYPVADVAAGSFNTTNVWRHVAMVANLAQTDGFVTCYIDGVQVLTWAGGDTRIYAANSSTPLTAISGAYMLGDGWDSSIYGDDFYFDTWDGAGVLLDTPPSSRRFLPAFPNGAGAYTQWTPSAGANYAAVDEAPPNNDTDYVKALSAGLKDAYAFANITVPPDYAVRAVIPTILGRKTDAAVASTLKVLVVNGSDETASVEKTLGTAYGYVWERFTKHPDGVTDWTEANVNASEFGIESSGAYA